MGSYCGRRGQLRQAYVAAPTAPGGSGMRLLSIAKAPGDEEAYHRWCTKRLTDAFEGLSCLVACGCECLSHQLCAGRPARAPDFLSGSSAKSRSCSSVPSDCSHSATCQPAASKRGGALSGTRLQAEHSSCRDGDPFGAWNALQMVGAFQHVEPSEAGSRRPHSKLRQTSAVGSSSGSQTDQTLQVLCPLQQQRTAPCRCWKPLRAGLHP